MKNYEELLGELIGKGNYRDVYQHKIDKNLVIKKMRKGKVNQNETEWKVWSYFKNTQYESSFCPCHHLSEDKQYLVMSKALCYPHHKVVHSSNNTTLLKIIDSLPIPILPQNIHDIKNNPHNWGILNGKKVIVDYGAKNNLNLLNN